jgi:hypothetical protein
MQSCTPRESVEYRFHCIYWVSFRKEKVAKTYGTRHSEAR